MTEKPTQRQKYKKAQIGRKKMVNTKTNQVRKIQEQDLNIETQIQHGSQNSPQTSQLPNADLV